MKESQYNYIIPLKDKVLFFNGLTERFFFTSKQNATIFANVLSSPDKYINTYDTFITKMLSDGFIKEDDINEVNLVKDKLKSLARPDLYFLMILPTFECNLRCWYCIQNHKDMFMSDKTIARVKKLLQNKIEDSTINEIHISWFGGEPLMSYKTIVNISSYAKHLCEIKGKEFSSAITTNGTLLNANRIEELRNAGVVHYQITIDGDRETHNSVKRLGTISAYDKTLDNIELIAQHSSVNLRFNYTKENLTPSEIIKDIKGKLTPKALKRIKFTLCKVWQENDQEISQEKVYQLFKMGLSIGMQPVLQTTGFCYTDSINYDCIFPNGNVGKCDNHNPDDMPGRLQKDGTIKWIEDMNMFYKTHYFDGKQEECDKCKYLPFCCGPCQVTREQMLKTQNKISCKFENKDKDMHIAIVNHCKSILPTLEI